MLVVLCCCFIFYAGQADLVPPHCLARALLFGVVVEKGLHPITRIAGQARASLDLASKGVLPERRISWRKVAALEEGQLGRFYENIFLAPCIEGLEGA